jgi:hypothetical protein
MVSSGMFRHVALARTDVSEERSASFIRVTRIGELGTTLAVTSNRRTLQRNTKFLCSVSQLLVTASVVPGSPILVTLMKEALNSSETSVLTSAIRHNIPEDTIVFTDHVGKILVFKFLEMCGGIKKKVLNWNGRKGLELKRHNLCHSISSSVTCIFKDF